MFFVVNHEKNRFGDLELASSAKLSTLLVQERLQNISFALERFTEV